MKRGKETNAPLVFFKKEARRNGALTFEVHGQDVFARLTRAEAHGPHARGKLAIFASQQR